MGLILKNEFLHEYFSKTCKKRTPVKKRDVTQRIY